MRFLSSIWVAASVLFVHICAIGQSNALQPVTVLLGDDTVRVGCDTVQVLDRSDLAVLTNQAQTEEQLMTDLITEMKPAGGAKSDVKDIKKQQRLWTEARDRHCADEVRWSGRSGQVLIKCM
jgi:hypothetical protein